MNIIVNFLENLNLYIIIGFKWLGQFTLFYNTNNEISWMIKEIKSNYIIICL